MKGLCFSIIFTALALLLFPLGEAQAQWNNAPYQPSFRGPGGGVGMSPGYRQIIILDRLSDGISRNNWFRGPSGQLVDIQRQDGQAFVVSPEGFPVGPRRSITRSGGFGYAGLEAGIPSSYRQSSWQAQSHASIAFDGWWPMVAGVETLGGRGYSSSPINGWISQLENL